MRGGLAIPRVLLMAEMDDRLTRDIISAAIVVSKQLGNGLLESAYHKCLSYELSKRGLAVVTQPTICVVYDGIEIGPAFKPDLIVNELVIVEVKAISSTLPVHRAQLRTYTRLSGTLTGLLLNFHAFPFTKGIIRLDA
ncbi:MAG: GxxExxY protein [Gemmatimonadales bacterium]